MYGSSQDVSELSEKLSQKWGIPVDQRDLSNDPALCHVLTQLDGQLDSSTMRLVSSQAQVEKGEMEMTKRKVQWLQTRLLYEEISSMVDGYSAGLIRCGKEDEQEFYSALKEAVTAAECRSRFHLTSDSRPGSVSTGPLGLVESSLPSDKLTEAHLHQLNQLVNKRLRNRVRRLAEFYRAAHPEILGPEERTRGAPAQKAEAAGGLEEIVQEGELQTEECRQSIKELKLQKKGAIRGLKESLKTCIDCAEEFLTKQEEGRWTVEMDRAKVEWLLAKCDALCTKLKLIDKQILSETYTADMVAALRNIKLYIEKERARREAELHRSSRALRSYETISVDFDSIVADYRRLQKEIGNKKWALEQLTAATGRD